MTKARFVVLLTVCSLALPASVSADTYKVSALEKAPEGLAEAVQKLINPAGYRIEGPDGPVCDLWFLKTLQVQPGFQPTFTVKYPLTPGQLVGALRVPKGAKFADFRGQTLAPGVYTIRYGRQPEDGNHIGTSDILDFLLALPAKEDSDPKPIQDPETLAQKSAKAVGTTHPAIFSILPVEKPAKKTTLTHDSSNDYWILDVTTSAKQGDKLVQLPVRMIVIGRSPE